MPTYEYKCASCSHEFEELQSIKADPLEICPACGERTERQISGGAGLLFKGSGFYITDYRSDSYNKASKADKKSSDSTSTSSKTSSAPSSAGSKSSGSEGKKSTGAGSSGAAKSGSSSGSKPSTSGSG